MIQPVDTNTHGALNSHNRVLVSDLVYGAKCPVCPRVYGDMPSQCPVQCCPAVHKLTNHRLSLTRLCVSIALHVFTCPQAEQKAREEIEAVLLSKGPAVYNEIRYHEDK